MAGSLTQASGTSIIMMWGRLRPEATKKSATLSSAAESLPPRRMMGRKSSMFCPHTSLDKSHSRASIQVRLPRSVLISPLCASKRKGCASCHDGKVLVLKRECTSASLDSALGLARSG